MNIQDKHFAVKYGVQENYLLLITGENVHTICSKQHRPSSTV